MKCENGIPILFKTPKFKAKNFVSQNIKKETEERLWSRLWIKVVLSTPHYYCNHEERERHEEEQAVNKLAGGKRRHRYSEKKVYMIMVGSHEQSWNLPWQRERHHKFVVKQTKRTKRREEASHSKDVRKDAVFASLRVYETIVMKGGHYERTQKGQKSDDLRFFLFESFRFSLEDALEWLELVSFLLELGGVVIPEWVACVIPGGSDEVPLAMDSWGDDPLVVMMMGGLEVPGWYCKRWWVWWWGWWWWSPRLPTWVTWWTALLWWPRGMYPSSQSILGFDWLTLIVLTEWLSDDDTVLLRNVVVTFVFDWMTFVSVVSFRQPCMRWCLRSENGMTEPKRGCRTFLHEWVSRVLTWVKMICSQVNQTKETSCSVLQSRRTLVKKCFVRVLSSESSQCLWCDAGLHGNTTVLVESLPSFLQPLATLPSKRRRQKESNTFGG